MNYQKVYDSICSKQSDINEYGEIHHILPRCMGGDNSQANLVRLSARAHFLAHWLLTKIYPDNIKLKFAFNMMLNGTKFQDRKWTAGQYAAAKKANSLALSILHKGRKDTPETTKRRSEAKKGKSPTPEARINMSKAQMGHKRGVGRKFSETTKQKIKDACKVRFDKGFKFFGGYRQNIDTPEKVALFEQAKAKGIETFKRNHAPKKNNKGYEILTPSGFQPFNGVAYSGLVPVLKFRTTSHELTVSSKHRFDNTSKQAKHYKVGDFIHTCDGPEEVIEIIPVGKKQVYDILEVAGGNLYYANGIQNHNCEIISDETRAVIPEWLSYASKVVVPHENIVLPEYTDWYVAADLGYVDLSFIILAFQDFERGKTVVVSERVLKKATSAQIQETTLEMEREYLHKGSEPHRRIIDAPLITIADLNILQRSIPGFAGGEQASWCPALKDDKEARINNLRLAISRGQLEISTECPQLAIHLRNAMWNKKRTSFERSEATGHSDGVDALIYLIRHIDFNHNPFPRYPNVSAENMHDPWATARREHALKKSFEKKTY